MISRRVMLAGVGVTALHWGLAPQRGTAMVLAEQLATLTSGDARRLQVQMEATGNLELDPTGKKVTTTPFRVRAEFDFVEKVVAESTSVWVAKDFDKAEAKIQVGRGSTTSKLADTDEIIVHRIGQIDDSQIKHEFSRASERLAAEEIDLIHLPGIAPVIDLWFVDVGAKKAGDSWTPESWTVAAALAIDSVTQSKLTCRLRGSTADKIEVTVQGSVSGVANSVPTELTVSGRCMVDARSEQLVSLVWEVQEKRTIGPATPGFDGRTKIEVTRQTPVSWTAEQQAQLEAIQAQGEDGTTRLAFESEQHGFRLEHGPHWKVIGDNPQAAILRFVDEGDLIAQAHITRLKDLPPGGQLSKQKYREDVANAIKETEGQIVDVTEATNGRGYQALRVVVSAEVSGVPIQWIYYHITDAQGQRIGWVITLEQDRIDRFGAEDQILVESFEILKLKQKPATPKTAERPATIDK